MLLPEPRGPLSAWVIDVLRRPSGAGDSLPAIAADLDAIGSDDLQLALWTCYELHYRGFDGVADEWEWDPRLLQARSELERPFVRHLVAEVRVPDTDGRQIAPQLSDLAAAPSGRSMSRHLQRGEIGRFREWIAHRSIYHLKEADPHTWAVPRLSGAAKAALVEIQADEYGGGRPERMHATLFADLMRGLGLDDSYGGYVNSVPGITLATNNVMSLFGLHRRWRGAVAGHLAALELTSSAPSRRYARGLRRLGFGDDVCRFHLEHIEADAVHEQVAMHDLCATMAREEPSLAGDILFGAACAFHLEQRLSDFVFDSWTAGHSSLRRALRDAA